MCHCGTPGQEGQACRIAADGGDRRLDRILEGLARPRCRHALYCLAEEEPQSLDDLTEGVVDYEVDADPTDEQRDAVRTDLYHNVLPKLADLHLVEYDSRSETVCFRNPPADLEEFLVLCRRLDSETE